VNESDGETNRVEEEKGSNTQQLGGMLDADSRNGRLLPLKLALALASGQQKHDDVSFCLSSQSASASESPDPVPHTPDI
jgi:hypothetical protein